MQKYARLILLALPLAFFAGDDEPPPGSSPKATMLDTMAAAPAAARLTALPGTDAPQPRPPRSTSRRPVS